MIEIKCNTRAAYEVALSIVWGSQYWKLNHTGVAKKWGARS